MRVRSALLAFLVCTALVGPVGGQELAPGTTYDSKIPTIKSVLGWDVGEEITPPDGIVTYLKALAAAAPERTRLIEYARSWERRPLYVLLVSSPERIARLDEIQAGLQRLADPRGLSDGEADRLARELPVMTWLMHAVHGNEISSSDAALAEAYHLLAARGNADVDRILAESIVMIDPLENPDGRARFIASNTQGQAADPDVEPVAAERDEPWPGGRANHYLFDMNRDWFAQSQRETQGRTKLYLDWYPQVVVDLHEMGGNSTYYFAPPADPLNPHITKDQVKWFEAFGRGNAASFDERGFSYFIREVFDSFYPGYGESWPIFHGAIGMTYEQASPRGLAFRRQDDTVLTYRYAVVGHFTAAIATAATAAKNREQILRDFLAYRRSAIAEGEQGVREYVLLPGSDPSRAGRLATLLARQGIEVRRAEEPIKLAARAAPAGAFVVSAAQPAGRLVRNLLDPQTTMDEKFVKEQDRRRRERLGDQIYDVTGWSLPFAFDVELETSDRPLQVKATNVTTEAAAPAAKPLAAAKVAYLIPWGADTAAAVVELLRAGVAVQTADQSLSLGGRRYAVGTAIIRVAGQQGLQEKLAGVLARYPAVEVVPADTGWVDEGISLGSGDVVRLKAPKVAMAWDAPASSLSAGWMRYVIERRYGQPVTAIRARTLENVDLRRFDVLALPSGTYTFNEEALRRLKDWIRGGGTLITVAEASRWAAREKIGLLETRTLLRDGSPDVEPAEDKKPPAAPAKPEEKPDYEKAIQPERERPENTPGAMLRVRLNEEHWLTAGFDGEIQAIVEGNRVFAPIRLDKGRNVGVYVAKERLVASGLAWDNAQALLAEKAFLVHQPMGLGHIIAFAEDPNYRAFTEATQLLFMNAIVLGPSH